MVGNSDVIGFLIENGAQTNRVRSFGQTALKTAVIYKHTEAVELLLQKGANVCENTEKTALQYAIESEDSEILNLLEKSGAKNCK